MSSKQYLKKLEGTSTPIATRYKPAFSDSEYTGFGELYRNGKWYKDVAVFADDFSTDTTSNYTAGNSTLSIADSRMKVVDAGVSAGATASFSLIEGKKYRLITKVISGTAQVNVVLYNNPSETLLLNSYGETVTHDFIASSSVAAYYYNTNGVTGEYVFIESIVVIPLNDDGSIDISNATELTTPQTYLPIEVDIDEQGNLLNVDRMDLPTLVEDYVIGTKKIHSGGDISTDGQFKGKNACTAWVVFRGNTTVPVILDSYNVSSVVKVGTGIYHIYYTESMSSKTYTVNYMAQPTVANSGSDTFCYYSHSDTNLYKCRIDHFEENIRRDVDFGCVLIFGGKD